MLERVIENWLDKASERSFQLCYCYMLSADGHIIIHSTRHCGMEMGKDIITVDSDGTPCAFQLKTGNISLAKWRNEIGPQIDDLVFGKISHPSVENSKHHKSYLVTNGRIEEEVSRAIDDRNRSWKDINPCFRLRTVVRGELLEKAQNLGTNLWPSELTDTKTLLELFLENGRSVLPKEKLASLLESTLPLRFVEHKKEPSKDDCKRRVASAAILCGIATWSFSKENNHAAEIEAWTMYIAYVLALAERWKLPVKVYESEFRIAAKSIYDALANLCDEIRDRTHLMEPPALADVFIYRVRLTWLMALMGIYALWRLKDGLPEDEVSNFLQGFFKAKQGQLELWGEAVIPQFLAIFWHWRKIDTTQKTDEFLRCLIESICKLNRPEGKEFLASPYYEAEDILPHIFGVADEPLMDSFRGESYALEGLVHLCVRKSCKASMQSLWPNITRLASVTFEPATKWEFYRWRNEEGKHKIVYPKHTQDWEELKAMSFEAEGKNIPTSIKKYPILLLLFLCVYPHRMNSEILRWLDTEIKQIPRA